MDSDLMGIALNLQKKYTKFNEIYNLTKQIEESLYRDDMYSLRLIVNMRTTAILELEKIEYNRKDLINALPDDKKNIVNELMSENAKDSDTCSDIGKKINNIYRQTRKVMEKTVLLDKAVNKKLNTKSKIKY
ncbi:MAG: hypothetical protein LKJ75_03230 [Clostridia bacterium]|jgi:hypothetical protein|nr:hypothetical protein [Clostridia bacterium]MCI2014199.1 hypothetical protein [Clostridia bacterium]